jgi:hypothetical protein
MQTRLRLVAAFARSAAVAALASVPLSAQRSAPDVRNEAVVVGSDAEHYLRVLQVAGAAPLYPWGIRAFSPAEVDRLLPDTARHPWRDRMPPADTAPGRVRARWVRPQAGLVFNSAFPQGTNDGALWAGRGVTASASAGFEVRVGSALSLRVEPMVFWAQNASFPLMDNGRPDSLRFRNPHSPASIDLPQRFGDGSFARVDPGQSTLRLDHLGFAAGLSTANMQWGPAVDQPLLVGPNGGGFPHLFAGTSTPWNIGLGRVHGRVMWGSLGQSDYAVTLSGHGTRRYASGIFAVFIPARLDGLEIGLGRFFHEPWPEDGLDAGDLMRPLESFYKGSLDNRDEPGGPEGVENQMASAYIRWALPRGGFEVYGEFIREDHNYDLEDLILEPDRSSGYMVGGRKAWRRGAALHTLRAEWVNAMRSHLNQGSFQGPLYRHTSTRQGHTVDGQLLGSPAAFGGGGAVVAFESFTPRGRWRADWTRTRVADPRRNTTDPVDVIHSLGAEVVSFRGRVDWVARVRGSLELNRYYEDDAFNLNASLGVRLGL